MADAVTSTGTPSPTPGPAVDSAAADAALFGKYTALANTEPAPAPKTPHAHPSKSPSVVRAPAADAARVQPARSDAGRDGKDSQASRSADSEAAEGAADDAGSGEADGAPASEAAPASAAIESLSESEAISKARAAWKAGDNEGLDAALKAILPGSKGLSEFAVDGKRYGELRAVTKRANAKLEARAAELAARERNVSTGLAQVEQLVQRYQPIEELLSKAKGDDVDAYISLIEKATGKPLNETVKRHLDKKLNKPGDPEVENLKRELAAERGKREDRERQEQDQVARQAHAKQIEGHLVFLDQQLSKSADPRVVALVKSPEGMRAIFQAQQSAYDRRNNTTLSPEQAALQVIAQKQKELEPWQRVLSPAQQAAASPTATSTPAPTQRAKPLGNRNAASASKGGRTLSDPDLFAKYERLAKLAE